VPVPKSYSQSQPLGELILQLGKIRFLRLLQEKAAGREGKVCRGTRGMRGRSRHSVLRRCARIADRCQRSEQSCWRQQVWTEEQAGRRIELHRIVETSKVE